MLSFGKLSDMIEGVRALNQNNALYLAIQQDETKDFIITLNTEEQLFEKGINSEGVLLDTIGGGYKPSTIAKKQRRGLPYLWVTLFDTGDFYSTFKVKPLKTAFTISADTIKTDTGFKQDLQERWGEDILGLSPESKEKLGKFLIPYFQQYILDELINTSKVLR